MLMAVAAFVVGMGWLANDPYKGGIYGPIMALCAALMLLLISLDPNVTDLRKGVRGTLAALFGGVSAYFWIADNLEKRPTDPEVWLGLGLAWYLVLGYGVATVLIVALFVSDKSE